jgi:hypothetical protein
MVVLRNLQQGAMSGVVKKFLQGEPVGFSAVDLHAIDPIPLVGMTSGRISVNKDTQNT